MTSVVCPAEERTIRTEMGGGLYAFVHLFTSVDPTPTSKTHIPPVDQCSSRSLQNPSSVRTPGDDRPPATYEMKLRLSFHVEILRRLSCKSPG
ncbi:hypothetical protein VTJ04DRAFT_2565 [Mycothermus thermophilus]|uniref:uncharacterized protein n=1 Tax=Humicola insolens TaxID=85995 RepID=UPI00374259FC